MLEQISLFGIKIHAVDMRTAVETVLSWCHDSESRCRYVVTPNVDHTVMFQSRADLRQAYTDASLVLADGAPVVLASRLLRRPLPERVAGSDLVPAVFEQANSNGTEEPLRVFLLGAGPGVASRAARSIEKRWTNIQVVGTYSPPLGFENDDRENENILALITEAQPQLLLVGLGAPKQELWVQRHAPRLQVNAALCVGATIDFLAGEKSRSPVWMRRLGLEWLHRLSTEPARLAKRYLRDAWIFPQLVWREWRGV
jgi:N-acetylglucosaminyldiphosphoundecaprenol N-acetyl-beta-D-mannosaminyltransferase